MFESCPLWKQRKFLFPDEFSAIASTVKIPGCQGSEGRIVLAFTIIPDSDDVPCHIIMTQSTPSLI